MRVTESGIELRVAGRRVGCARLVLYQLSAASMEVTVASSPAAVGKEPAGSSAQTHRQQRGVSSAANASSSGCKLSNLDSFFSHSAPVVPVLPSSAGPAFALADLWQSMEEWSSYGVEIPLRVPAADVGQITQCYVPYLSAIQIFNVAGHRCLPACARGYGSDSEEMDSLLSDVSSMDMSCSDSGCCSTCTGCSSMSAASSDYESAGGRWREVAAAHMLGRQCRTVQCCSGATLRKPGYNGCSKATDNEPGELLYEFTEEIMPHCREPLTERVAQLSNEFPGLTTLRSCDIHPSSWFSIAWYPLYRLPATGRTIRDLNACFLTFHSLAAPLAPPGTPLPAAIKQQLQQQPADGSRQLAPPVAPDGRLPPPVASPAAAAVYKRRAEQAAANAGSQGAAVLQPFAFVPYKMGGHTWEDDRRATKLQLQLIAAAGVWAQRRGVSFSDLSFFLQNLRSSQHGHRQR